MAKRRRVRVGTKLRVMLCDKRKTTTEGTLIGYGEPILGSYPPKIRLRNGKTVYGYQCWWLPLAKAVKAEKSRGIRFNAKTGKYSRIEA